MAKTATRGSNRAQKAEAKTGWAFMAPFAIVYLIVFIVPIIVAIKSSFFQVKSAGGLYGGGQSTEQFVGLANYQATVTSATFWKGMARVFGYTLIQVPIMIILAMALALLLDSFLIKHVAGFRLGYFLPYAICGIVGAIVWVYLYTPQISPLISFLRHFDPHVNLMGPGIVLVSMANMTTWTYTGYNMLIFLAALQAIPHDLYEAARIDGATGWQVVRRIKVPLLGKAALLAVLLSIVGTIQLFNEPSVLAAVNTWMGNAYTPMMMAYNTMMGQITPGGDGPASAISIVMAIIAGILASIYAFVQRKVD